MFQKAINKQFKLIILYLSALLVLLFGYISELWSFKLDPFKHQRLLSHSLIKGT